MLSKKDYEAIAKIIAREFYFEVSGSPERAECVTRIITDITKRLADYFEQDNPRFNRKRFLAACGLGD